MTRANGFTMAQLHTGQSAGFEKTLSQDDVAAFARISGDTNPVHLDADYAATTIFKGPIVHGMLTAGLISTVIGTRLPGCGTIYLSQSLSFKGPVRPGDVVRATVTIESLDERRGRATLHCTCHVGDKLVLDGTAVVMPPRPPKPAGG